MFTDHSLKYYTTAHWHVVGFTIHRNKQRIELVYGLSGVTTDICYAVVGWLEWEDIGTLVN
jgi:hypothetical protein